MPNYVMQKYSYLCLFMENEGFCYGLAKKVMILFKIILNKVCKPKVYSISLLKVEKILDNFFQGKKSVLISQRMLLRGKWIFGGLGLQQMSYNDQESHHLLIWLNKERLLIGEKHRIYSFDQLRTSRIIPSLLNKINAHFFSDIYEIDFEYKSYLLKIEKYLNQVEDLKFKRNRKQELIDSEYISEMVKLILFLIMRHEIKQEFVNRILQLQDETQMYLMYQIKKVESWLENKMEIKEVLQTIEGLEEENEMLNQKLREIEAKNKQVAQLKAHLQQENAKLIEIHRINNTEKSHFIEELGIPHPKEYLTIYKDIICQRNDILSSHAQSELLASKLGEENKEMQEKIAEDALIIDHLNEEISKYRQIYCHLRKSTTSQNDFSRLDKENIEKQCSTTLESIRMVKSAGRESDNTSLYQGQSVKEFEEDEPLEEIMQNYQEELVAKLQEMYVKIGALNNQISTLKTHNDGLAASNRQKERIISQSFEEHQQFSFKYKLTIK